MRSRSRLKLVRSGAGVPSVTVVGSVNLDLVARCERFPQPGETLTGAEFQEHPGGKGANQALAAARLGAEVRLVAGVGRDYYADPALWLLDEGGVDLEGVATYDAGTGVALILVAASGENQIVVAPGANRELDSIHVRANLGRPDAVLCQLEVEPLVVAAAAHACSGFFCLNAAPAREIPESVLRRADLIVVNELERDALPAAALEGLVAVTRGREGASLLDGGREVARAEPPAVEAVDTTGAGDAFTACLLVSLLERRDREEALRRACAAGALAASRPGAQPSLPTAEEVDARLG